MPLFNLITLLGFGFGVVLTIILLSLSVKKTPKHFEDFAFGVLLIACVMWHGGNFLALLIRLLFGSVAAPTSDALFLVASFGLVALPSSLLHVAVAMLFRHQEKQLLRLKNRQIAVLIGFYLPMIVFLVVAGPSASAQGTLIFAIDRVLYLPFIFWLLLAITSSVIVSEKLIRLLERKSDRQFYRDMSYLLAGLGIALIFVYILPLHRLAYVGRYMHLFMLLSSSIPLAVFAYYIYRYNFYRLVIKPSLVYSIIYGLVMAVYLIGIRRFGEYLGQFPEINSKFIEGLLLVALVFAFQPLRQSIQTRLDKIFFKDRYFFQQSLRELSASISSIVDLEKLLLTIREKLSSTYHARACSIVVFFDEGSSFNIYGDRSIEDPVRLFNAMQSVSSFKLRRQIRNQEVAAALAENRLELAVPISFKKKVIGLVCLAEKENGNNYSDEELDVLQTFANQVGLAIENARLVQDRLNLEAKVFQSEKLTSLGQLATTLAHEIKNPLSSIKTIIQVLHENMSGSDARDLELVIGEINRLNSVLEKLLSFARPSETGIENVDLLLVSDDVIALLRHQARLSNVELNFEHGRAIPTIKARLQSVREIVFNLLLNAIQALVDGGEVLLRIDTTDDPVDIKQEMRRRDDRSIDVWVRIRVSDNGPGIDEDVAEVVFEPFSTTKTVGTGLGLSIVKRNVEEIGGTIRLSTSNVDGTTFDVYLPVYSG